MFSWLPCRRQLKPAWGHWLMGLWAALGAGAIALQPAWVQRAEGQFQALFLTLGRSFLAPPPEEVVILAIDEESLAEGQAYQAAPADYPHFAPLETWPWRRAAYAEAIDKLMGAGARAVGLDLLLIAPSAYGPEDDQRLRQVLQRHGDRVVLAAAYEVSSATGGQRRQLLTPLFLTQTPVQAGLINVPVEADRWNRRLPNDDYLTTLAAATGIPTDLTSFSRALLAAADQPIPALDGTHIYFYGPAGTFRTEPFAHVLDPQNWARHQAAGTFRDKWVLIGPTADSLQDFKRTPVSENLPGVELHANILAAYLENRAIARVIARPALRGAITALLILGIGSALSRCVTRPGLRILSFAIAMGLWVGAAYGLLLGLQRQLPVAVPTLALGLGGLTYTAVGALGDRWEQQRLRRTLERYVAPAVVAEILQQPGDYRTLVSGKRLRAAVLFSDIRGFSRLAFRLPAEALVTLLNGYLAAMVDAILTHRGTVDKFIGDAVMAEFGSPTSQGDREDALNAIRAALAMRRSLAALREQQRQVGQPLLFHGIGISYGEVIAGNIGSPQRLEYTAIGDTVNVASRIEALTKPLGTDLLITAPLYELVREAVQVIDQGQHRLAGREEEWVQVYSVVGFDREDAALYERVQQDLRAHLGWA